MNRSHQICTCLDEYYLTTMAAMRETGTFIDCTIILDDGSRYAAHQIILCAHSAYLRNAICVKQENRSKSCEIFVANIQPNIMEIVMDYIYTRHLVMTDKIVLDLFAASNLLQIHSLTQLCSNYVMTEMLNADNCLHLMIYARDTLECGRESSSSSEPKHQQHGNVEQPRPQQRLSANIRRYALDNFVAVAQSNYLPKLSVDDLCDLIADDHLNVKDEKTVWACCQTWLNHDYINRIPFVARLLKSVRLGLLDKVYFNTEVMRLPALKNSQSARLLIDRTLQFWECLNEWPTMVGFDTNDMVMPAMSITPTPDIAMPRIPMEVVIVLGGQIRNNISVLMESYDLRADKWIELSFGDKVGHGDCGGRRNGSNTPINNHNANSMESSQPMTRCYHGTVTIGWKIYCIGGFDGRNYLSRCSVFDAVTKQWQEIAPMHLARCHVAVTECNGRIYAIGGYDGSVRMRTMEMYDPANNQWTMLPSMHYRRSTGTACALHGRIYAIGGFSGSVSRDVAEYYDPMASCWHTIESMTTRRSGLGCAVFNGCVYAVGGFDGFERLATMEKYDPVLNTWHASTEMINARSNFGLAIADDLMFAIGGFDGISILTQTECYNFDDGVWIEANNLNHPRLALTACTISGIPNIRDYTYSHREDLLMEKRLI